MKMKRQEIAQYSIKENGDKSELNEKRHEKKWRK